MTTLTTLAPPRLAVRVDAGPPPVRPRALPCERSYAADLHGSRLTARGRALVALLWVLLAAAAVFAFLRPGAGSTDVGQVETTTVVIEAGDTVWALARSIDSGADPRALVDTIVELNGLRSGSDIRPGDVLLVPAAP